MFCCFFGCASSSFSSFLISSGSVSGRGAAGVAAAESSVCFLLASPVFSGVVSAMGHANPVLGV
jgi:hypothetical protein